LISEVNIPGLGASLFNHSMKKIGFETQSPITGSRQILQGRDIVSTMAEDSPPIGKPGCYSMGGKNAAFFQ
jgi:hypothetical protein